jgi:hypothetical protein
MPNAASRGGYLDGGPRGLSAESGVERTRIRDMPELDDLVRHRRRAVVALFDIRQRHLGEFVDGTNTNPLLEK